MHSADSKTSSFGGRPEGAHDGTVDVQEVWTDEDIADLEAHVAAHLEDEMDNAPS